MGIKKQFLKSKPVCKVTFSLPAADATNVVLVGSFNNWNTKTTPLKKLKNGTFKTIVNLEADTSHEFRYIVDGAYQNEAEADTFVWNDYAGAENSVLTL